MSDELKKPTLLDSEAMGGEVAEGGFKFQDQLILARIPTWLACDGFIEMIREALGDTEARFFAPNLGITREFVEYKNHHLTPSEFWPEIERFHALDVAHPGSYGRFVLVCTSVSDLLRPMLNGLRRLRDASPFYSGAPTVQDASYEDFAEGVHKLYKDASIAAFLFDKVFVDTDPPKSVDQGFELFRGSLERHFPVFQDMGARQARAAWDALTILVGGRKAKPIKRDELEAAIWSGVVGGQPTAAPIRLFTSSEPLTGRWELPADLRLDWSAFSGGAERAFPPADVWDEVVIRQLRATREWIIETNRRRRIILSGQRRLSASVAIGAVFNAVSGFAIDMEYRGEIWPTDDHAAPDTPNYTWLVDVPLVREASELAVVIGIGRDVAPEVRTYLSGKQLDLPVLVLSGSDPLLSARHTNAAVRGAKAALSDAMAKSGAKLVHLFLATPAHFALFLGHRLNATSAIQCYERVGTNMYHATCRLWLS